MNKKEIEPKEEAKKVADEGLNEKELENVSGGFTRSQTPHVGGNLQHARVLGESNNPLKSQGVSCLTPLEFMPGPGFQTVQGLAACWHHIPA